jgi:hypothetical protein
MSTATAAHTIELRMTNEVLRAEVSKLQRKKRQLISQEQIEKLAFIELTWHQIDLIRSEKEKKRVKMVEMGQAIINEKGRAIEELAGHVEIKRTACDDVEETERETSRANRLLEKRVFASEETIAEFKEVHDALIEEELARVDKWAVDQVDDDNEVYAKRVARNDMVSARLLLGQTESKALIEELSNKVDFVHAQFKMTVLRHISCLMVGKGKDQEGDSDLKSTQIIRWQDT